ncbi:uncharacterized protein LOC129744648 [Uranotaenia lowii]|uniref:uncharacterized protein LOC129744648 n=1 Tax=Uranotaenia lowii TaxID=190385 RepID=UPI002478646A|nr:uncharacterized protein LOC129744648 [Uranotaenia lowii]
METSFHFSEPVESPGLSGKRSQSICPAEVFLDSTHQINETTLQSPRIAHTHRVWPIEPHHHHVASSEASNYHAGSLTRRGSSPVLSPLRSTAHNDDAKDSPTDFLQTTSTLNLSKPVETPGLPDISDSPHALVICFQ